MQILTYKTGEKSIAVKRPGFVQKSMSYKDFFEKELYEPNKYSYVDSVRLENGSVVFIKIDDNLEVQYIDEYQIDPQLLDEKEFIDALIAFIENYDTKKEELNRTLKERQDQTSIYGYRYFIEKEGQTVYKAYVKTGIVPPIYRDEIALRILEVLKHEPDIITTQRDETSNRTYTVSNKKAELYNTGSRICGATSILGVYGSIMVSQLGVATCAISIATTGCLGLGAYYLDKKWKVKQKEIDDNNVANIIKELEQRYSYIKSIQTKKIK